MQVNPYIVPLPAAVQHKKEENNDSGGAASFGGILKDALYKANSAQLRAAEATQGLISGKIEDLHQLMIVTEQAKLSMQLTVQVTNKLIEAYREISRMQV